MNKNTYTTDEFGRPSDQDRERIQQETFLNRKPRRSAYDRYFEGWESVASVDSVTGRRTIKRVYTGTRYRPDLAPNRWKTVRRIYGLLYLVAIALFLWSMLIPTASNSCWYVVLAALVPGFFFAAMLVALTLYLPAGQELTIHEYRDGARRLTVLAPGAMYSMAAPAATTAVFLLSGGGEFTAAELLRLLLFVLSATASAVIGRMERGIQYTEILYDQTPNETETQ